MLSKFSVEIVWTTVCILPEFRFLQNVRELLSNEIHFLLVKDIYLIISVIKPWMVEHLLCSESLGNIFLEHRLHEVTGQLADRVTILDLLLIELVR